MAEEQRSKLERRVVRVTGRTRAPPAVDWDAAYNELQSATLNMGTATLGNRSHNLGRYGDKTWQMGPGSCTFRLQFLTLLVLLLQWMIMNAIISTTHVLLVYQRQRQVYKAICHTKSSQSIWTNDGGAKGEARGSGFAFGLPEQCVVPPLWIGKLHSKHWPPMPRPTMDQQQFQRKQWSQT